MAQKFMTIKNPLNLVIAIVVLCIIIAWLLYLQFSKNPQLFTTTANISSQKAADLVLSYINENMLAGRARADLAGDVQEEAGLYKLNIKVGNEKFFSYVTKDGKIFFPQGINLEEKETSGAANKPEQEEITIGNFSVSQNEICRENGKPIVYFFGADFCPHCQWQHPVVEKVVKKFEGYISFHNNMNSEEEIDVFKEYSTGGIPTVVLGCKYYRVGSGERSGEEQEIKNLTALICKLTDNQPSNVCSPVEDLVRQIK